jgi:putative inorganic carbon (HCO3(-)) transporter
MRDVLLISIILSGSLVALRRPWLGVMLWTWISVMNPHEQFGWAAATWPVGSIVAICTLIGLILTKDRQSPLLGSPVTALVLLAGWTCVTLPFSVFLSDSIPLWERSMKIWLMVLVAIALVNTRLKLDTFIWVVVASLAFYGVKGGVFTIATGGNYRVWGPGGFIGGNNELALALVAAIPLMRYLQLQSPQRWLRWGLGAAIVLTVVTVLGSHSRGALVALAAMTLLLWWKGEGKARWALLIVAVAAVLLPFMPDHWWERMETIRTYDEDESALGRLNAWRMAWNLACDRFFGGGFAVAHIDLFRIYAPNPEARAAHSIYFQVLGEHGFVGLFLFLAVGVATWRQAARLVQRGHSAESLRWAADLGAMIQVSMVGFGVGGAFLSLAYFDLPYNLMAMTVIAARCIDGAKGVAQPSARTADGMIRRPLT